MSEHPHFTAPFWSPRQQIKLVELITFDPHGLLEDNHSSLRSVSAYTATSIILAGLLLVWLNGVMHGLEMLPALIFLALIVIGWLVTSYLGANRPPVLELAIAYRWALSAGIVVSLTVGLLVYSNFIDSPHALTTQNAIPLVLVLIPLSVGLAIADAFGGRGVLEIPLLGIPALVAAYLGAGISAGMMADNSGMTNATKIFLSTLEGGLISVIVVTALYGMASDLSKILTRRRLPVAVHPPYQLPPQPQLYESRPMPPAPVPPRVDAVLTPLVFTLLLIGIAYLGFALLKRSKKV